ncbi:hypothetical protein [Alloactinosynnema sp. L-07]|uniref:hypothetical protein n=1 Tax=Alloactinosynnema sp. L-07 TaxID=1653480 RepID=UPI00065EFEB3|nr:hypothetical protein [Alloactinosynnema sp. L-07]CRK61606.1 hypothetical protein [Alloactinosynnema sp. L-07]
MSELTGWSKAERESGEQTAAAWRDFAGGEGLPEGAAALEAMGHVIEAQERHETELMRYANVVGVAASVKVTGGTPTLTPSLTVLVDSKKPVKSVPAASRVPAELDGAVTDVVETGPIVALVFNSRVRPALPGFSIGHPNITAGTFGALVRDLRHRHGHHGHGCGCGCCPPEGGDGGGAYLILSNNHVLAATNAGKAGDLILQPGPVDGGLFPSDAVATLDRFEPIVFGAAGYNLVDAAVARPSHSRNVTAAIIGQVIPRGIGQAAIGQGVIKAGRTTQVTAGTVTAINATVAVNYGPPGQAVFRHQILTTAMSAGGDSGSLLMSRELEAVGLLYAGSAQITVHNHISDVETALGVRPVTAPTFT